LIYVTGTLGTSGAVLNRLRDGEKLRPKSHPKHFYPEPRVAVGEFLREKKLASAMIDISDGLSTDLGHICDESKVGAVVSADSLPVAAENLVAGRFVSGHGFSRAASGTTITGALAPEESSRRDDSHALALHGGEEYELLFTARPDRRTPKQIAGVPITRIGEIVRGRQMKLMKADGRTEILQPAGWEHFG
jgi:thiamine-monophosphate kinase